MTETTIKIVLSALFWVGWGVLCNAQTLTINKTSDSISIDGKLVEAVWTSETAATGFTTVRPQDSLPAKAGTEAWLTYDDRYLYVAAKCHRSTKGDYISQSLKRDFSFPVTDAFAIIIDAFGHGRQGVSFGLSADGVQRDGQVYQSGRQGVTTSWDTKWWSAVCQQEDFWSLEMKIPLEGLNFNPKTEAWRINFARNDLAENELSSWAPRPRKFNVADLGFTGNLKWGTLPPKRRPKFIFIPYLAGSLTRETDSTKVNERGFSGLDIKIPVRSSLTIDLSILPDFSQVEVDAQIINLSRFERSFPEQRLFFLENNDLFSNLGTSRVRPFFSRRIGSVGTNVVPLLGGVKISGNLSKNWRVGILSSQTQEVDSVAPRENYTITSLQYNIGENLALNTFMTNRYAWDDDSSYNTAVGVELNGFNINLKNKEHWLLGKAYSHYTFSNDNNSLSGAYGLKARVRHRDYTVFLGAEGVSTNYNTGMGFVPRLYHEDKDGQISPHGYTEYRINGDYRFDNFSERNSSKHLNIVRPFYHLDIFTRDGFKYQEHFAQAGVKLEFKNTCLLEFGYEHDDPYLYYDFHLKGTKEGSYFEGEGSNYNQHRGYVAYQSDRRKKVHGSTKVEYGQKFLGRELRVNAAINYRPSSRINFGMDIDEHYLHGFDEVYGDSSLFLLRARAEVSFSKYAFWTTFLQYNTSSKTFSVNTRFQWRFQPMSDFHLVATNNYDIGPLRTNNWTMVAKFSYWLDVPGHRLTRRGKRKSRCDGMGGI